MGISTQAPHPVPADQPASEMMQLAGDAPENPEEEEAFKHTARIICDSLPGLVAQQIEVCQNYPDTIQVVSDGARRGIKECQFQFRHERWNCTTKEDDYSVFGYELGRGKLRIYLSDVL